MSDLENKPVDSNKEAAEVECKAKASKCLTTGPKTAEEVEAALKCLKGESVA